MASTLRRDAPPGSSRVASLILPHDLQWARLPPPPAAAAAALKAELIAATASQAAAPLATAEAADFLRGCSEALLAAGKGKVAILLGGRALLTDGAQRPARALRRNAPPPCRAPWAELLSFAELC